MHNAELTVGSANSHRSHFSGVASGNTSDAAIATVFDTMMMRRGGTLTMILLSASLLLTGCATSKDELLPPGDHTMLELWNGEDGNATPAQATAATRTTLRRSLTAPETRAAASADHSYSRTQASEISQQFPRLPNPDMVICIRISQAVTRRYRATAPSFRSTVKRSTRCPANARRLCNAHSVPQKNSANR